MPVQLPSPRTSSILDWQLQYSQYFFLQYCQPKMSLRLDFRGTGMVGWYDLKVMFYFVSFPLVLFSVCVASLTRCRIALRILNKGVSTFHATSSICGAWEKPANILWGVWLIFKVDKNSNFNSVAVVQDLIQKELRDERAFLAYNSRL